MTIPEYQVQLLELIADADVIDDGVLWWRRSGSSASDSDRLIFGIMCNDQFAWATADVEPVLSQDDADGLRKAYEDVKVAVGPDDFDHDDWPLLWVARKRGLRPQGAAYTFINEKVRHLFNEAGPERETGLGNPYQPGEYQRA